MKQRAANMWMKRPLDDILSSAAKVAVLRVLVESRVPETGREIGRRAGVAAGHVSRVLGQLDSSGVLDARQYGSAITYTLREDAGPVIAGLRELFRAERERDWAARKALAALIPEDSEPEEREVLSIILFGSEARGKARAGSDTDVLFIVRRRGAELEGRIAQLCEGVYEQYRVPAEPLVADLAEVREWEESGNPFWKNVLAEGIVIAGKRPEGIERPWQPGKTVQATQASTGLRRKLRQRQGGSDQP
jgi:predicted nucleotidyltransferase